MPKQNRYKNRFKSVGSSSIAPGPSSQLRPQAQGSLAPGQSSQAQASLASGKSSQLQPQAEGSSFSSYQASIPSSSSDEVSSQPAIPSAANGSKRTKWKDDGNDHDWLVDVIGTQLSFVFHLFSVFVNVSCSFCFLNNTSFLNI